ncbi:MAG: HEAT repeat domain-containing protein [Gemmataceae bacterium]
MSRCAAGWLCLVLAVVVPASSRPQAVEPPTARPEKLLKSRGLDTSNAALLDLFRKRTHSLTKKGEVAGLISRLADERYVVREQASKDLVELGQMAVPELEVAVQHPDLEIGRRAERCLEEIALRRDPEALQASVQLLSLRRAPGTTKALLAFLPQAKSWMLEVDIMHALEELGTENGAEDVLIKAAQSTDSIQRQAAAVALASTASPQGRAVVRQLLNDADPLVRLRAARSLLAATDCAAVPTLIALIDESPVDLAHEAHELLALLAGSEAPASFPGPADLPLRRKCRDAWQAWWQQRGGKVDLARVGWRLHADRELVRLVELNLRVLREALAANKPHFAHASAAMIAAHAQRGPTGASSPLHASLRDQALRLGTFIRQQQYIEARKQADALPFLTPNAQAALGRVQILNRTVTVDELMHFSFSRRGGMGGLELVFLKLEKAGSKEKGLPAAALTDELWLQAAYTASVAQMLPGYPIGKSNGGNHTQANWDKQAGAMAQHAVELSRAVQRRDGIASRTALLRLNTACLNCHEVFR